MTSTTPNTKHQAPTHKQHPAALSTTNSVLLLVALLLLGAQRGIGRGRHVNFRPTLATAPVAGLAL
jgi:hypothetical protein